MSAALLIGVTAGCSSNDATSAPSAPPPASASASPPSAASVIDTALVTLDASDASDASEVSDASDTTVVGAPVVESAPTAPPVSAPLDAPSSDPCALLTASVAAQAIGAAVGAPITQPGQGNSSCAYRPADPGAQSLVVLTLYGVHGSEADLDAAATQFPGAEAVDGVGDAARVSVQSQVIGVLSGSTIFGIGLYPQQADGQLLPVTEDQLIAVAHAVLDGR